MAERNVHVIINMDGRWSVRNTGAARATRVFERQEDAIRFARDKAKDSGTELYIHRSDGRIRERKSYAAEAPFKRSVHAS